MLVPSKTVICPDPDTQHRLNGNAFQQDALSSFRGWQYAAAYTPDATHPRSVRRVTLARRRLDSVGKSDWQLFTFDDYAQVTDDGHNTISIGICHGDGTIHVSFDHHCDPLKYRISLPNLATSPESYSWTADQFSPIQDSLPGLPTERFHEITYPRFVSAHHDLLFECRTGKAGAGSDMLFAYTPSARSYRYIGTFLIGIGNNPYINGLSFDGARLHTSWTYRGFVDYQGANDQGSTAHKANAGPNGPENNYDLMYASSADLGATWLNSQGDIVACCTPSESSVVNLSTGITPDAAGIIVQHIPKYSGIMNQEAQCVGLAGDFHVLNRDNTLGSERWRHFTRQAETGTWSSAVVQHVIPTETGPRGKLVQHPTTDDVYFMLPGNIDSTLTILRRGCIRTASGGREYSSSFDVVWQGQGFDGEPLPDEQRLASDEHVLSVFTRTAGAQREVIVLDFTL